MFHSFHDRLALEDPSFAAWLVSVAASGVVGVACLPVLVVRVAALCGLSVPALVVLALQLSSVLRSRAATVFVSGGGGSASRPA